jgi:LacI family transcriptional regulator
MVMSGAGSKPRLETEETNPERGSATIYSVAARAGVSIATVSRVLRGADTASAATIEKVREAASELNYVPQAAAQSLATRRYNAHAVVIGAMSGPYYTELMMGYESVARSHGQGMLVVVGDPSNDFARSLLELRGRVDGLMMAQWGVPKETIMELAKSMPVVVVGGDPVPGCDLVRSENLRSATAITGHLLDHGRRKLIFVGDPDAANDVRDRYQGFAAAHLAARLPPREAMIRVPQTEAAGEGIVPLILKHRGQIDGLVCANDELALAIMHGLKAAGMAIPEEMSVCGWDDVTTARYLTPALTTVRQPVREMGELAAKLLHERVLGAAPDPRPHTLPTEVVVRQSCGCP